MKLGLYLVKTLYIMDWSGHTCKWLCWASYS